MEQNTNNARPKLDLKLNESAEVTLTKDKPYKGNSAYGPYAIYSVNHAGLEKAFFIPQEMIPEMEALNLRAGDSFTIKKVAVQNGKRVISKWAVSQSNIAQQPASPNQPPTAELKTDGLREIMERSLREAVDITRSVPGIPFQNEDIQKIASCLFIART
jgi:hypothetical protein